MVAASVVDVDASAKVDVDVVEVAIDKNLSTFSWPSVLLMRLPQSDSTCVRRALYLDLR